MARSRIALLAFGVVLISQAAPAERVRAAVPGAAVPGAAVPVCNGKYKGGLKPSPDELANILKKHAEWLKDGGRQDPKLANDPRRANLCGVDLTGANLTGADLINANLGGAHMAGAFLSHAELNYAELSGAHLDGAHLSDAYLINANLSRANLSGAHMAGAHLVYANLGYASLSGANLTDAYLMKTRLNDAYLSKADLTGAHLDGAILASAHLFGAFLRHAELNYADLTGANLYSADLSDAHLINADLDGAYLARASLRHADLTVAHLSKAKLNNVDLTDATYAPASEPPDSYVAGIKGLATLNAASGEEIGLIQLRKLLQDAGLSDSAREATFSIQRNITEDQLSSRSPPSAKIEGYLRTVGLEWTTAYGLHPERALRWILLLGVVLTPMYMFAMLRPTAASGVMQVFPAARLDGTAGDPTDEEKRKKQIVHAKGWRAALPTAAYFSLISAVNIGFEDFTPGDWIRRLQTREYSLEAVGWVRVVAGAQALLSVYLLAMWVLTQFGKPFE